jgi:hypothetical protein
MAALSASNTLSLAAKFMPQMVTDIESSGSLQAFKELKVVDEDDYQGTATVIDGGTGAEQWVPPGGSLPTGGSVAPLQTQYGPKQILDRLIIPEGIVIGNKNRAQGVNTFLANAKNCASRMARSRARAAFKSSSYTLTATINSSSTTFTVTDISWARVGMTYAFTRAGAFREAFTVAGYTYTKSSGTYTITLAAATTLAMAADDVIYQTGALDDGMDSLADVAGSSTFQGIDPTNAPNWKGVDVDNGTNALSETVIGNASDDAHVASGVKVDYHAVNPRTLRKYHGLFADERRYRTGDKLDRDILVPSFDGQPILASAEVPEFVWHGIHKDHVLFHEYKKVGPLANGTLDGRDGMDAGGLTLHPTLNAYEMRITCKQNLRVLCRNSSFRIHNFT